MSVFVVDQEKCKRCWACVAECPRRIIEIRDSSPIPTIVDGSGDLCINCGHCVAVCPYAAFSLQTMSPVDCLPMQRDWAPGPEYVEHYMRARRSIRAYRDEAVDRNVLAKLIDIARFAPTGSNQQPVRWLVVYDSDRVHKLAGQVIDWMRHLAAEDPSAGRWNHIVAFWESGVDYICRGAPHLIIAHAPKGNSPMDIGMTLTNCTIALTYLELAAPAFGLGTCWGGFLNGAASVWEPVQKTLALPEGNISYGVMMVGYPRYKYHRLPLRNEAEILWH